MKMDKNTIKSFNKDFKEAVKELELKYGVKISHGGIRFSETEMSTKLTISNDDEDSARKIWEDGRAKAFFHYPILRKVEYGKTYTGVDGKKYVISGFNTRRPKNILKVTRDGKTWICNPDFLKID